MLVSRVNIHIFRQVSIHPFRVHIHLLRGINIHVLRRSANRRDSRAAPYTRWLHCNSPNFRKWDLIKFFDISAVSSNPRTVSSKLSFLIGSFAQFMVLFLQFSTFCPAGTWIQTSLSPPPVRCKRIITDTLMGTNKWWSVIILNKTHGHRVPLHQL